MINPSTCELELAQVKRKWATALAIIAVEDQLRDAAHAEIRARVDALAKQRVVPGSFGDWVNGNDKKIG